LLELIAVLAILGLLGAISLGSFRLASVSNVGAQADARTLAFDLQRVRQQAITTGIQHEIRFESIGGVLSYRIGQNNGAFVDIDTPRTFSQGVSVTYSRAITAFEFQGGAQTSAVFNIDGPDRSYTVSVVAATGAIQLAEN